MQLFLLLIYVFFERGPLVFTQMKTTIQEETAYTHSGENHFYSGENCIDLGKTTSTAVKNTWCQLNTVSKTVKIASRHVHHFWTEEKCEKLGKSKMLPGHIYVKSRSIHICHLLDSGFNNTKEPYPVNGKQKLCPVSPFKPNSNPLYPFKRLASFLYRLSSSFKRNSNPM